MVLSAFLWLVAASSGAAVANDEVSQLFAEVWDLDAERYTCEVDSIFTSCMSMGDCCKGQWCDKLVDDPLQYEERWKMHKVNADDVRADMALPAPVPEPAGRGGQVSASGVVGAQGTQQLKKLSKMIGDMDMLPENNHYTTSYNNDKRNKNAEEHMFLKRQGPPTAMPEGKPAGSRMMELEREEGEQPLPPLRTMPVCVEEHMKWAAATDKNDKEWYAKKDIPGCCVGHGFVSTLEPTAIPFRKNRVLKLYPNAFGPDNLNNNALNGGRGKQVPYQSPSPVGGTVHPLDGPDEKP